MSSKHRMSWFSGNYSDVWRSFSPPSDKCSLLRLVGRQCLSNFLWEGTSLMKKETLPPRGQICWCPTVIISLQPFCSVSIYIYRLTCQNCHKPAPKLACVPCCSDSSRASVCLLFTLVLHFASLIAPGMNVWVYVCVCCMCYFKYSDWQCIIRSSDSYFAIISW